MNGKYENGKYSTGKYILYTKLSKEILCAIFYSYNQFPEFR